MNGEAINVDNLGRTVINESGAVPPPVNQNSDSGFLSTFFSFIGKGIVGLIGMFAGAIFIASIIYFLAALIGISSLCLFHQDIYDTIGFEGFGSMGTAVLLITMIGSLATSIIFGFTACSLHKFTARIASYATLARSDNARNTSRTYSNCSRNVISDDMIIAFLCTLLLFLLLN